MKRESIMDVYPLIREIPKHENAEVRITGNTFEVMEKLPDLLKDIGRVIEVVHYRKSGHYLTFFVGQKANIVVDSGLTSGYVGVGTNRFVEVLQSIGIEEGEAKNIVHNKHGYDNAEVVISLL